jgi:hypothetical protein
VGVVTNYTQIYIADIISPMKQKSTILKCEKRVKGKKA